MASETTPDHRPNWYGILASPGLLLFLIAPLAVFLASCSGPSNPGATSSGSNTGLSISSPAFQDGDPIPVEYTCDGADLSPPLEWSSLPDGTRSVALILDDPDAPGGTFVHWVLYNIPADMMGLLKNESVEGLAGDGIGTGRNDFDQLGYGGPCPPPGGPHLYRFKVYALDDTVDLESGATKSELRRSMRRLVLDEAELTGTYQQGSGSAAPTPADPPVRGDTSVAVMTSVPTNTPTPRPTYTPFPTPARPTGSRLSISSPVFRDGDAIPMVYTCDGVDVSPPLEWSNLPNGTRSVALIMDDPDAPGGTFVHWVVYNIPADSTGLLEVASVEVQEGQGIGSGRNDFDELGYGGPCPPPGDPHRYSFKVYALDDTVDLARGATKSELLLAMDGRVLAQAELTGTYTSSPTSHDSDYVVVSDDTGALQIEIPSQWLDLQTHTLDVVENGEIIARIAQISAAPDLEAFNRRTGPGVQLLTSKQLDLSRGATRGTEGCEHSVEESGERNSYTFATNLYVCPNQTSILTSMWTPRDGSHLVLEGV